MQQLKEVDGPNPARDSEHASVDEGVAPAKPYVPIETLDFFNAFEQVSDAVWRLVESWKPFAQETIGKQLVRSADSINLNLAEGDGRYSRHDAIHFFVIARASARETRLSLQRAVKRGLIETHEGDALIEKLTEGAKKLNLFIRHRRDVARDASRVRESIHTYGEDPLTL